MNFPSFRQAPERLAVAAHEIRNPAQALTGLTDLLCSMDLPAEAQACAQVIRQSAKAILAVVDDALDIVRLQRGFIHFVAEPFEPETLVTGTVEMLHRQAAEKGLDLAGFIDPLLPARFIGDAARIRQVLLNLAGNAIKFTERGGVGLAVHAGEEGGLVFIVDDTGPGLDDAGTTELLSPFDGAGHDNGGLGLGLTISAEIVHALGGTLSVEAREGGGSRFQITLPCEPVRGEACAEDPQGDRRPVLIVSPTPFTGPYLERTLQALGHAVQRTTRPDRAEAWLSRQRGAIMLADAALGRRGLAAAIRRARAAGCERIAVLRALGEERGRLTLAATPDWPVIRKPVNGRAMSRRLDAIGRSPPVAMVATRPTALVVDDCAINRLLACHLLEQNGFQAVAAADGVTAVNLVADRFANAQEPFHLILVDFRMPGLDGMVTARQIRGIEALFLAAPAFIAGLSALVDEAGEEAARAEGMDAVVAKPLSAFSVLRLDDAARRKGAAQQKCHANVGEM